MEEMRKRIRMELDDVVDSGAEIAEVSVDTVRNRYLKKLASRVGIFNVVKEQGMKYLVWKEKYFPFKELIKKYSE